MADLIRSLTVDKTALTITSTPSAGITVTLSVRSTSAYYRLTYFASGANRTAATPLLDWEQVSALSSYTITDNDILTLIYNRQIDTITFYVDASYSSTGSPTTGNRVSVSVMVNIDSSLAPTFSISSIAVSSTAGEYSIANKIIADGKTRVIANMSESYATGASFSRLVLTPSVGAGVDTQVALGSSYKFNAIPMGLTSDTAYTISYALTDSRGFVTTGTYDPNRTCYSYTSPTVNIIAYRVNAENDTSPDPEGAWLYYRLEATCTDIVGNLIDDTLANTYIQVGSGTAYAINTDVWEELLVDATATLNARVKDTISYTATSYTVGTAAFPIDLCDDSQGNVGGGFGCVGSYGRYEFAYPAVGPGCVEFIRGTQTASTYQWKGVSRMKALREGTMILYFLNYAGTSTAATLNLTLADGGTTGAIKVYYNSTTRMTNQFGANSQILLVYHEQFDVNGTTVDAGWWHDADRDSDTMSRLRLEYSTQKTYTVLYRYMICFTKDSEYILPANTYSASGTTATTKTLTTESFNPFGQVYYYANTSSSTVVAAGNVPGTNILYTQYTYLDLRYSFNTGSTLTANKAVYLVCEPQSDGTVKLHTPAIAQDIPTTVNGLVYKLLGHAYDTYRIVLYEHKPCYIYDGHKVCEWTGNNWFTIWEDLTSPLQGGSGMTLDMTKYSKIKVYFMSYSSSGQFEIDLSNPVPRPSSGTEPYSGSGVAPYWNASSSRLETHICWAQVGQDKDTFNNNWQGYYYGTSYVDRNNYADYYIYRIDAMV